MKDRSSERSDLIDIEGGAPAIFLTVGTSLDPFDRLLRMADELVAQGRLPGPVVAQTGHGRYAPRHMQAVPFLPAAEVERLVAAAGAVICHGGAGSIGTCLLLGRRPVVVPRRVQHGEIVNDHQLQLCRAMAAQGRIYVAEDPDGLALAVAQALRDRPGDGEHARSAGAGGAALRAAIARLLGDLAADR